MFPIHFIISTTLKHFYQFQLIKKTEIHIEYFQFQLQNFIMYIKLWPYIPHTSLTDVSGNKKCMILIILWLNILFYHCITLYCWTFSYLHISSSKFFTLCKCISLNLCCSKKVLFRNLKFVSWHTNISSAPNPHGGSNRSLFISVPFQLFLFWPGFQSLTLKLQPLHIFVLIGSVAKGSELIGQIAGGCGSA